MERRFERTGDGVRIDQSVQQLCFGLDDEGIMACFKTRQKTLPFFVESRLALISISLLPNAYEWITSWW
jgi:hypothetical protein